MARTRSSAPSLALLVLALITVQVGFGGYGIVLKKYAKGAHTDALVFSICRDGFASPILLIAAAIFERGLPMLKLSDVPLFFLLGLTGMFGNQFLYIEGLYYATPNIASIFQPCIPVFTVFFAFITCMEPLPGRGRMYQLPKLVGIALAVGGAVLMTLARQSGSSGGGGAGTSGSIVTQMAYHHANGTCTGLAQNTTTYSGGGGGGNIICNPAAPGVTAWGSWEATCTGINNTEVRWVRWANGNCSGAPLSNSTLPANACTSGGNSGNKSSNTTAEAWEFAYTCAPGKPAAAASDRLIGIFFLLGNCSCMAVYVLLQKKFIFGTKKQKGLSSGGGGGGNTGTDMAGRSWARWAPRPVAVTAYSYLFGALCMGIAAGIRYAINGDASVFVIPNATLPGLAYAVLVASSLCYGLITWTNKYLSPSVTTSLWPLQVFVTIILSYIVFGETLQTLEYVGMGLIIVAMLTVVWGSALESKANNAEPENKALLIQD